jgi:hypothetical protein
MCQLIASALLPSIVLVVVVITSRFVAPRAILLVTPAWGGRAAQMILVFIVNPSCRRLVAIGHLSFLVIVPMAR